MNVRTLPDFASGVITTCPAPAFKGWKIACFKQVTLTGKEWEQGKRGYCERHTYLEESL